VSVKYSEIVNVYLYVVSVDEKERAADRNPEKELADSGFHDYQRQSV